MDSPWHALWQFSWDFTKVEIMTFFWYFFPPWHFPKESKLHFSSFNSKKGSAEELKDFRPISLVGSLYKLLANVLANRLKLVVREVVQNTSMFSSRIGRFFMLHSLQTRQ